MSEPPLANAQWDRARKGDEGAFSELVTALHPAIFRIALGMLGDFQEAEDVTQEVFLRAWNHLSQLNPETGVASWLRRVAINASLDHLRRRRRRKWWPWTSLPLNETPANEATAVTDQNELADQVYQALKRLPEHYRVVAVLREIDGLTYDEIAAVLGCSVGTVRSRLARARERLRTFLKPHFREWEKGRHHEM